MITATTQVSVILRFLHIGTDNWLQQKTKQTSTGGLMFQPFSVI